MKFELHKKCRYEGDRVTDDNYKQCVQEYLRHLAGIDFSKAKSLLKYFGFSFFHDATVKSLSWTSKSHSLELLLFSENTLEDLNEFRRKNELQEISQDDYADYPILYQCTFTNVSTLALKIDTQRKPAVIMDSELHFNEQSRLYEVIISFWGEEELRFDCKKCTVKIINPQTVIQYTDGRTKSIPYCKNCRYLLITPEKLKKQVIKF